MEEITNNKSQISPAAQKALNTSVNVKLINVAQDFVDGIFYYGVRLGEESFLITSNRKILSFVEAEREGIKPLLKEVDRSEFSSHSIKHFLSGKDISASKIFISIKQYIKRYIYLRNNSYYDLITLWLMGTYVFRIFRYYPYIHLSAEKGSGKTLLMEILAPISFNGDISVSSTAAVIFRNVHVQSPTLYLDEAEKLYKNTSDSNNAMLDILRSGYNISGTVKRCEKDGFAVKTYSTYCPKMFASINDLDEVLRDRTIKITMVRKLTTDKVETYFESKEIIEFQKKVKNALYVFGLVFSNEIFSIHRGFISSGNNFEHLNNRNASIWAPIITLAQLVDNNSENPESKEIESRVYELSKELVNEKFHDDTTDNQTLVILNIVEKMLKELPSVKTDETDTIFDTESVLDFFSQQDEFEFIKSKTALSRLLKKVKIQVKPYSSGGTTRRAYVINKKELEEYSTRYGKKI